MRHKLAVCPWIGHQLFFVQALGVIQCLLCGIPEIAVCISLKGCQVIQMRRILCFPDCLNVGNHCIVSVTHPGERIRLIPVLEAFRFRHQAVCQADGIELLRNKRLNAFFPVYDHRQCRRHHPANLERSAIKQRVQPCRVNAHQPVSVIPAKGRPVQIVIFGTILQGAESFDNGFLFQGRDPQAFHRQLAAGFLIYQPEDQFALAPGIRSADNMCNPLIVHQLFQNRKLLYRLGQHSILPYIRQDRKILIPPGLILFVIYFRLGRTDQMTDTPADNITVSADIAFVLFMRTEHVRNGSCHAGLFCNHKLSQFSFLHFKAPACFLSRGAV